MAAELTLLNSGSGGIGNRDAACGGPKYCGGSGEHATARTTTANIRISDFALIYLTLMINW